MSSSSHCRRTPNSVTVQFTALVTSEDSAAATLNNQNEVSGKKLIQAIETVVAVDAGLNSSAVDIPSSCEITVIESAEIEHKSNSTNGDNTGI